MTQLCYKTWCNPVVLIHKHRWPFSLFNFLSPAQEATDDLYQGAESAGLLCQK